MFAPASPASTSGSSLTVTATSGGGMKKMGASTLVGVGFVGITVMGVVFVVSRM